MADKAESQGLGVISATVMVANCAIGAGVLFFPFVVRCCGVAVGAVLIVLGSCILGGSLHILASASALSGGLTYQGVMRLVLPPRLANACGERAHFSRMGGNEVLWRLLFLGPSLAHMFFFKFQISATIPFSIMLN